MKPVNCDNYRLGFSSHPDCSNPMPAMREPVCVGGITDMRSGRDCAYLFYDPYGVARNGYRLCVQGREIYFDMSYHALLYSGDPHKMALFEAAAMHECGHIIKQHDLQDELLGVSDEQLRRIRLERDALALDHEYEADAFAASVCGVDAVVDVLDYLIEMRKQRGFDPVGEQAVEELALRKQRLLSANK